MWCIVGFGIFLSPLLNNGISILVFLSSGIFPDCKTLLQSITSSSCNFLLCVLLIRYLSYLSLQISFFLTFRCFRLLLHRDLGFIRVSCNVCHFLSSVSSFLNRLVKYIFHYSIGIFYVSMCLSISFQKFINSCRNTKQTGHWAYIP